MAIRESTQNAISWVEERTPNWISRHLPERGLGIKQLVLGTAAIIVLYLVLSPLVFLLWASFWSKSPGNFDGTFTLSNYSAVYLSPTFDVIGLFQNSVWIAVGMTVVAGFFGLMFAWLFARTNLPTKSYMELVIIMPYAVPVYLYAIMYISTYGPRNGYIMQLLMNFFGWETAPINIFSPWGISFVVGINAVTTFYLLTVPALQDMDPSFEEVSRIHGGSWFTTIRSVSFPIILPAILSALFITFVRGLGEFSVVAILGVPAQFHVYATAIWSSINLNAPPQYGAAAALSISLLIVTAVLIYYYRKVTARKEDFMTVTGSGYQPKQWDLGKWRWPMAGVLWAILFIVWILPMLIMFLVSIHSTWLGDVDLTRITIENYVRGVFSPVVQRAFINTILISVGGAILGTTVIVLTSYYTERTDYPFRGVVDFMTLTPLAIPGIILGASVLFTYLWIGKFVEILDIYGTIWIIMIGSVIVFIPVVSRMAAGNIVQIHNELEESARILGATWLEQMREVFLPLFKSTIGVIWVYLFIHLFQLLTIPIMTYTTGTEVISVVLFNAWVINADLELVSALSIVFIVMMMILILLFRVAGIRFYELNR